MKLSWLDYTCIRELNPDLINEGFLRYVSFFIVKILFQTIDWADPQII